MTREQSRPHWRSKSAHDPSGVGETPQEGDVRRRGVQRRGVKQSRESCRRVQRRAHAPRNDGPEDRSRNTPVIREEEESRGTRRAPAPTARGWSPPRHSRHRRRVPSVAHRPWLRSSENRPDGVDGTRAHVPRGPGLLPRNESRGRGPLRSAWPRRRRDLVTSHSRGRHRVRWRRCWPPEEGTTGSAAPSPIRARGWPRRERSTRC